MVGAAPSFSDFHVVRALLILWQGRIGRKKLVRALGIGEGSVRTILKKLRMDSLIKSDALGQELTARGKRIADKYLSKFTLPQEFHSSEFQGRFKALIIVHDSSQKIGTGIEQRDIAIFAGAKGAIILLYEKGRIRFPTRDVRVSDFPKTLKKLKRLELRNRDVVVIPFADDYSDAENAAIAIALNIMG